MWVVCECVSSCLLRVEISKRDKQLRYFSEIRKPLSIISDYCTYGPEPGDKVVSKGKGYMIYEEA